MEITGRRLSTENPVPLTKSRSPSFDSPRSDSAKNSPVIGRSPRTSTTQDELLSQINRLLITVKKRYLRSYV
jgi:hypothetical protein